MNSEPTSIQVAHQLSTPLISQVVYKLTDFGYAKSYDKSSVCTSLVGTVQYVVSVCMVNLVASLVVA